MQKIIGAIIGSIIGVCIITFFGQIILMNMKINRLDKTVDEQQKVISSLENRIKEIEHPKVKFW